ncbi:hypothetical protein F8M41_002382 [Gigaspora margarita]|uniref:Uncharacterized protein n=1 Tax=Gigaspora margarita TaxID=4874 RepID=A0A8H3XED7_GIGMA|nr:hypothetical protein F8M41_002382 [Gigaspora margarita]
MKWKSEKSLRKKKWDVLNAFPNQETKATNTINTHQRPVHKAYKQKKRHHKTTKTCYPEWWQLEIEQWQHDDTGNDTTDKYDTSNDNGGSNNDKILLPESVSKRVI